MIKNETNCYKLNKSLETKMIFGTNKDHKKKKSSLPTKQNIEYKKHRQKH